GPGLLEQLGRVERRRCSQCRSFDARGTQELLLDASLRERFAMPLPLPAAEAEELRRELGACYIEGASRQRWAWSAGGPPGWIEFRPRGVLWTKDDGVGAWEPLREWDRGTFLAVHLCDRAEVRHVLRLRDAPDAAGCLELEEWHREVSRPLGFCRRSPERRAWCRSHAAVPRPALDSAGGEGPAPAEPAAAAADDPPGGPEPEYEGDDEDKGPFIPALIDTLAERPGLGPPDRPPDTARLEQGVPGAACEGRASTAFQG
ncbi:unnamed protein product, partial [Prorocentrum cordatum]